MGNYREVWENGSGEKIPKGWHVHHLIPRSEKGPDEYWNLICVSPEMHYDIHFARGDDGACSLISDGIDREPITTSVRQYDLSGYFIKEWKSINEAASSLDLKPSISSTVGGIVHCCKYTKKSLYGFQWFYTSEVGDLDFIGPVKRDESKIKNHDPTIQKWKYDKFPNITLSKNDVGRILMGEDYKDKTKRPHGTIFNNNKYFEKHFKRK